MVKANATYNRNLVYETQDLIVSAISQDFNNVGFSIADYDSFAFEQEDPLGMAFYTFAILETDYKSQEFTYKPDYWKYWMESRLESVIPTSYIDTELSAMGLILYALSRRQVLPDNAEKFIELVDDHFSETTGIYKNYLASVLVGLGISRLTGNEQLLTKIKDYINNQLTDHRINIYNDPKNLVVTYLWSKEFEDAQLRNSIKTEVFNKYETENYLDRDIIYLAYILIEEIGTFSRVKRQDIKLFIEESIKFIRNYTLEGRSAISPAITGAYGNDIALESPEMQDIYGYPNKPILSRILLSLGLLIEQKYVNSPHIFDGSEQLLRKTSAVVSYLIIFMSAGLLIFWCWGTADFINNFKTNFQTQALSGYAVGLLKVITSTLLLVISLFFMVMATIVPYYLLRNIEIKHTEALIKGWDFARKYVWYELGAGILINILTSL